MKFTTTAMKNGIIALLLMSSAASAQMLTITPANGVSIEELAQEYLDFRILAKASSLDNNANGEEWILEKVQFFERRGCGGNSLITADNSFISSDTNEPDVEVLFNNDLADGDVNINRRGIGVNYWVGYSAAAAKSLGCVRVRQKSSSFMTNIEVQVQGNDGNYKTLYNIAGITATGIKTFRLLDSLPSDEPSIFPSTSLAPSLSPSQTPSISGIPSVLPSGIPSVLPSEIPSVSGIPSVLPSVSQIPSQIPSESSAPSCSPSTSPSPTKSSKSTKAHGCGGKGGTDGKGGKGGGKSAKSKSSKSSKSKSESGSEVLKSPPNDSTSAESDGGINASLSSQISVGYDSVGATSVMAFGVLVVALLLA